MRVAIAGAGNVGRSIARELITNGHSVVLLEKSHLPEKQAALDEATWVIGDACEISVLELADLPTCQVMIAATGDDKVNLVVSLLAKTEYAVPRVVARVNHPRNEWMFDEAWGVDVAVSTPRMLSALVEEAVTVGELVTLMQLRQGSATLMELTLPNNTPVAGHRVGDLIWPVDTVLVAIIRDSHVIAPSPDDALEGADELLFVTTTEAGEELTALLGGRVVISQRG